VDTRWLGCCLVCIRPPDIHHVPIGPTAHFIVAPLLCLDVAFLSFMRAHCFSAQPRSTAGTCEAGPGGSKLCTQCEPLVVCLTGHQVTCSSAFLCLLVITGAFLLLCSLVFSRDGEAAYFNLDHTNLWSQALTYNTGAQLCGSANDAWNEEYIEKSFTVAHFSPFAWLEWRAAANEGVDNEVSVNASDPTLCPSLSHALNKLLPTAFKHVLSRPRVVLSPPAFFWYGQSLRNADRTGLGLVERQSHDHAGPRLHAVLPVSLPTPADGRLGRCKRCYNLVRAIRSAYHTITRSLLRSVAHDCSLLSRGLALAIGSAEFAHLPVSRSRLP
jgi:hypothetical protein